MATGTRSLPTDSPVPYFQPIERGHMSEGRLSALGSQEGLYVPPYVNPWEIIERPGGTDYHPDASETDKVSSYMGLDDYDTLFAARHGRGALGQVPRMSEQLIMTTSVGITPPTSSTGLMVNPLGRVMPAYDIAHPGQREHALISKDPLKPRVVSPSSKLIEEGAAIFTDMTETILDALDQQMAITSNTQQSKGLSIGDNQIKRTQGRTQATPN